jgi:DNA-binding CsgD family transcriptional regulator/tetratricopeptide (TPR) repeat protein
MSSTPRLIGRANELEVLFQLVDRASEQGEALVVHGEPGVGKTSLLRAASRHASERGALVLRTAGVQSEVDLAFSGLHQLLAPVLGSLSRSPLGQHTAPSDQRSGAPSVDVIDRLPAPKQQALRAVFGLGPGPVTDRFMVGLAVLGLLSEIAEERPLLCLVDDAQWLDGASAHVLTFVARRLLAEPIAILIGVRQPGDEVRGLPKLEIRGLREGDARALLGSVIPYLLDERVRERIVAETRGNPLALLELPRGLSPTQLAGGFGLVGEQVLPGRIEESFLRQLDALPKDVRSLLQLAAAEPVGDPMLVWDAADRLGIGVSAAAAAEAQGLLAIGERVMFRHPLVRSAVYRSAAPKERRAVHLALAEVTDPQLDPDRRAWHLAAAAAGPDEEVASELERSAGRAQARGGLSAAAGFLQRSVELSREPARRTDRALAAAQANLHAGAFDAALGMLAMAETGSLDEFQRARIDLLRGETMFASGLGSDAPSLLLKAAKRLESLDLKLARETYLSAWGAAAFAEREGAGDLPEVSRAARALPPRTEPPRPPELLLDGLALLITDGRAAAAPRLRQAASCFSGRVSIEEGPRWGWLATAASFVMWDNDGARAVCARQIQLVRDTGALEGLPLYLVALGLATAWSGDFEGAASVIAELDEVTAATGAQIPPFAELLLLALRGREGEASALIASTLERAAHVAQGPAATEAHWAAAVLHNGLGRYEEALTAAQQASSDPLDLYPSMWALPELVEAAVRCGQDELARHALERLAATTQPSGTDFSLGLEARSRALLTADEAAEGLYRESIERLGCTRLRPELARAHLLYGEWLRRESRRVDARAQLRKAHDVFVAIGMEAFAGRARVELLATGEKVRKRRAETRDELTAQERQIALLAGDGLSNPEIGTRLFLSPRTIEWHLRKVFPKLGISSRRGLAEALRRSDPNW